MRDLRLPTMKQQQWHILTGNPRAAYHQCETLLYPSLSKETLPITAPVMSNSSDLSEKNEWQHKSYATETKRYCCVKPYTAPLPC